MKRLDWCKYVSQSLKTKSNIDKKSIIFIYSFFLGFFGFLDLDFALQRGQIGAFLWICWWQLRHVFIGGGCCWYRKGGGLGIGVIEPWLANWGLDRPRLPNIGECCPVPVIERKGFCCGGARDEAEQSEESDFSESLTGIGQGSVKDLSFSKMPADFNRSFSSSDISGSFSKSRSSVLILLISCFKGTYSDKSFLALSYKEKKILNAVWLECQLWQDCDTIMSEQNINDIQQQQRCSKLALEKFHLLVVAL